MHNFSKNSVFELKISIPKHFGFNYVENKVLKYRGLSRLKINNNSFSI